MKIKKGQKFIVIHRLKGIFKAVALESFDTDLSDFYPIATLERVRGKTQCWNKGDLIPCRRTKCRIVL